LSKYIRFFSCSNYRAIGWIPTKLSKW